MRAQVSELETEAQAARAGAGGEEWVWWPRPHEAAHRLLRQGLPDSSPLPTTRSDESAECSDKEGAERVSTSHAPTLSDLVNGMMVS